MKRSLKTAILRTTDCADQSLKPALKAIDGVRVIVELGLADDLVATISQTRPDALVIAIGENPIHLLLAQVSEVIKVRRNLNIILAGPRRDPDLLVAAMRSGIREFVELPTKPEQLLEILQKIIESQQVREAGKLIAVLGCGGGSGASFIACNLAVELAAAKQGQVSLVDLDLSAGQLSVMLDLFPTYTLMDLCNSGGEEIEHAGLQKVLLEHGSGIKLLARPKELNDEDRFAISRMPYVLNGLVDSFDYVIVDLDLKQDVTEGKLLSMVDELVLVTQPVLHCVHNASRLVKNLSAIDFDQSRIKLVVNRVPAKAGSIKSENIEKSLGCKVLLEVPDDSASVSESLNLGIPLSEYAPNSQARLAVRDLAMAIVNPKDHEKVPTSSRDTGLWRRLFGKNGTH